MRTSCNWPSARVLLPLRRSDLRDICENMLSSHGETSRNGNYRSVRNQPSDMFCRKDGKSVNFVLSFEQVSENQSNFSSTITMVQKPFFRRNMGRLKLDF